MKKKFLKPSYEKIVIDFDKWLKNNYSQLLSKDSITSIKAISHKWENLKSEYIEYMLDKFNELIASHKNKCI